MSLPSWKPSLCWASALGVLVAVGVGVYRLTPPAPMCEIDAGRIEPHRFVDNGRLVTLPQPSVREIRPVSLVRNEPHTVNTKVAIRNSPVRVWDARTGNEIAKHLSGDRAMHACTSSNGGRWFAAEVLNTHIAEKLGAIAITSLILLDLENGKVRELPLEDSTIDGELHFSPSANLLLRLSPSGKSLRIYDTTSGRLRDERASTGLVTQPEFGLPDFTDEMLVHRVPTKSEKENVEIWSPHERKLLASIENVSHCFRGPGDRYMVVNWLAPDEKEPSERYSIWNLQTNQVESEFRAENEVTLGAPFISDDGRFLALASEGPQGSFVELRELPAAKRIATVRAEDVHSIRFSPGGRFLAVTERRANQDTLTLKMLAVPTMNLLWQKDHVAHNHHILFSRDASTVFTVVHDRSEAHVCDSVTGQRRARISSQNREEVVYQMTLDRRFVLVHDPSNDDRIQPDHWTRWLQWLPWLDRTKRKCDTVIGFDMDVCRERFRLHDRSFASVIQSDDKCMLATAHDEANDHRILRCWDMNAWKPLHAALSVPAGLGTLLVLAVWWRSRRTRKPQAPLSDAPAGPTPPAPRA